VSQTFARQSQLYTMVCMNMRRWCTSKLHNATLRLFTIVVLYAPYHTASGSQHRQHDYINCKDSRPMHNCVMHVSVLEGCVAIAKMHSFSGMMSDNKHCAANPTHYQRVPP
jgi:succinate dehydrogenase hydrophobic anchor subunit